MASPRYRFSSFCLLPDQRLLTAGDSPVKLGGRAFDTLLALVERRDRTVSKHELLDLVWPKLVVEENNLQVQMVALRKLLGHQAIATIPGRGYRFTLPVEAIGDDAEAIAVPVDDDAAAAAAAPLPTRAGPSTTNLPPLPTLFGRDDDLRAVLARLATQRVVTIAGAGGVGKTRLAQAVGHAARTDFRAGVWWVELAAIADPVLVAAAVARVLDVQIADGRDPTRAVLSVLDGGPTLVVLDNAEHVLDGVVAFADAILAGAPQVRLLVTSQEVLRSADEQVVRLDPLQIAAGEACEAVTASGAGALFCARAAAADPRFRLDARNVGAVAEICRRLDGIPLAIELAAARVPLLGVEGVRARLGERFSVLTAGARVVLRRHQTLRAALEWSCSLLETDQQKVLRRLGVFAGGFTLELAQQVADDETMDAWDVLEHLGALVDKSLVLAEGEPTPRYRMLETTRLFALERLAEAGETALLTRRHAEAMGSWLRVFDAPDRRWRLGPHDRAALAAEIDNVRAALDWAEQQPVLDEASLELVASCWRCLMPADVGETLRRLLSFRSRIDPGTTPGAQARFWFAIAKAGVEMGRAESFEAARRAAELFERLGDDDRRYEALALAVAVSARLRESGRIEPLVEAAVRLERDDMPPGQKTTLAWGRHRWLLRQDRPAEARVFAERQAMLARLANPLFGWVIDGANVAYCELAMGRAADAEARAERALTELGGPDRIAGHVLDTLMLAIATQGRYEEAEAVGRRALVHLRRDGDEFRLLESLALVAAEQGRLEDAAVVVGHVDRVMAASGEMRWPLAVRWRERLDALLATLPGETLAARRRQGESLRLDQAFAHAFADAVT